MVKLCRTRMQQFFCDMLNYQQTVSANIVNIFVFLFPTSCCFILIINVLHACTIMKHG